MTLLVRDERDIVGEQLSFHLAAGVDHVIVTDHASSDGTREILSGFEREGRVTVLHEPEGPFRQREWVTRMARLAATEHDADWVVTSDADEFWWPRGGSLAEVLGAVPRRYGVVQSFVRHFVPVPDDGGSFGERMTYRLAPTAPINDPASPWRPYRKVVHRASPDIELVEGGHAVRTRGLKPLRGWYPIECLHFPLRTAAQVERKGRAWGDAVRKFYAAPDVPRAPGTAYHALQHDAAVAGRPRSTSTPTRSRPTRSGVVSWRVCSSRTRGCATPCALSRRAAEPGSASHGQLRSRPRRTQPRQPCSRRRRRPDAALAGRPRGSRRRARAVGAVPARAPGAPCRTQADVRVVLTLLVRDEEDVLEANLAHHLRSAWITWSSRIIARPTGPGGPRGPGVGRRAAHGPPRGLVGAPPVRLGDAHGAARGHRASRGLGDQCRRGRVLVAKRGAAARGSRRRPVPLRRAAWALAELRAEAGRRTVVPRAHDASAAALDRARGSVSRAGQGRAPRPSGDRRHAGKPRRPWPAVAARPRVAAVRDPPLSDPERRAGADQVPRRAGGRASQPRDVCPEAHGGRRPTHGRGGRRRVLRAARRARRRRRAPGGRRRAHNACMYSEARSKASWSSTRISSTSASRWSRRARRIRSWSL